MTAGYVKFVWNILISEKRCAHKSKPLIVKEGTISRHGYHIIIIYISPWNAFVAVFNWIKHVQDYFQEKMIIYNPCKILRERTNELARI